MYRVLNWKCPRYYGIDVLNRYTLNMAFKDKNDILDQIYRRKYVRLYIKGFDFYMIFTWSYPKYNRTYFPP